jgi:chromosome segregation ATPase
MTQHEMPNQGGTMQNIIQMALQGVWDRAQKAVELITQLRSENTDLSQRIEELEAAQRAFEAQLAEKDSLITKFQEKTSSLSSVDVGDGLLYLSPDEREALERQIGDLLKRINAHLGASR